jgi:phosphate transport system substrate-binding protein
LTCAQLKQIWEPDSKIKTWSDLDPAWPAQSILLFGADTDSGTFEYFTEVINGKKKATNTNYTPASDDNVLVQGIATNQNSLGYIPFGYYIENTEKLKAIAISPQKEATEPSGEFIEPSVDSILAGKYAPLSRPLFMYVDKASLKRPEVYQFLKFAVSVESQPLVEKRGFVRVNEETRENAAKTLDIAKEEVSVGP